MFSDSKMRQLVDFPDASDVFGSGIKIKVASGYFLRDEAWAGQPR